MEVFIKFTHGMQPILNRHSIIVPDINTYLLTLHDHFLISNNSHLYCRIQIHVGLVKSKMLKSKKICQQIIVSSKFIIPYKNDSDDQRFIF